MPSYDQIQALTGMNRLTIAKAIRELVDSGWIEASHRFGKSTVYTLIIPESISTKTGTKANEDSSTKTSTVISPGTSTISSTSCAYANQTEYQSTYQTLQQQQPPDDTFENPVIQIHLEVVGIPLDDGQRKILIERVNDLARWRESLLDYRLHTNWKKSNLSAQLDRYANWDSIKAMSNGHSNGNGKSRNAVATQSRQNRGKRRPVSQPVSAMNSEDANAQALADLEAMRNADGRRDRR